MISRHFHTRVTAFLAPVRSFRRPSVWFALRSILTRLARLRLRFDLPRRLNLSGLRPIGLRFDRLTGLRLNLPRRSDVVDL